MAVKFQYIMVRYNTKKDFLDWIDLFEDLAALHGVKKLEHVFPGILGIKAYPVYKNL